MYKYSKMSGERVVCLNYEKSDARLCMESMYGSSSFQQIFFLFDTEQFVI